tara:strand:- start:102 stop:1145 length:1044 start_codon:yes stop_codon:yes gene_type:complete
MSATPRTTLSKNFIDIRDELLEKLNSNIKDVKQEINSESENYEIILILCKDLNNNNTIKNFEELIKNMPEELKDLLTLLSHVYLYYSIILDNNMQINNKSTTFKQLLKDNYIVKLDKYIDWLCENIKNMNENDENYEKYEIFCNELSKFFEEMKEIIEGIHNDLNKKLLMEIYLEMKELQNEHFKKAPPNYEKYTTVRGRNTSSSNSKFYNKPLTEQYELLKNEYGYKTPLEKLEKNFKSINNNQNWDGNFDIKKNTNIINFKFYIHLYSELEKVRKEKKKEPKKVGPTPMSKVKSTPQLKDGGFKDIFKNKLIDQLHNFFSKIKLEELKNNINFDYLNEDKVNKLI